MQIRILFISLLFLTAFKITAQWGGGEKYPDLKPHQEKLEQFQDMRFGMFVHWGPSSIRGTSSWGRGNHPYDFAPRIPINQYDSLYLQFDPVFFNAKDWISTAKNAGMKYFVITTKHHDGFCLWDSKFTEYDIGSTPYGKDVLRKLSKECRKQGVLFGTYYSINDWHHPKYPGRYGGDPRPPAESDMAKYETYMSNQLDELIYKYKTNILWFDGYWEGPWTHEKGMDLYKSLRDIKYDLLINNRVDRMRADREGKIHPEKYAGDYGTPEQEIGEFNNDHPWESCITISDGWHWRPHGRLKTLKELIHLLVQTVGGGGNLLLNVGPMPDGRIEMFQKKRLVQMGQWLKKYGTTIYETRGGPFKPNEWIASTNHGKEVFIHVLNWKGDTLLLPPLNAKIQDIRLFDGQKIEWDLQEDTNSWIFVDERYRDLINTILVLTLDRDADNIPAVEPLTFKHYINISVKPEPDGKYGREGADLLIDRCKGSMDLYSNWLGFEGQDFEVNLDFGSLRNVSTVEIGFLQNQGQWIFLPAHIDVFISSDGNSFVKKDSKSFETIKVPGTYIRDLQFTFEESQARYLQIKIKNPGLCPDWHPGKGGKSWIFMDEISVH